MKTAQTLLHRFEKLPNGVLLWTIIILGFVIYFRMFLNGFVGDDIGYINHPYIQQLQLFKFFQSSSADLGGASPITGQFFRPLMLVLISLIYTVAGNHAFFYHLIQLVLHLINVLLLFFLFKNFFSRTISFLLTLIYLIHPINIEAVAYISDLQEVLFVCFGLIALNVLYYFPVSKKTLTMIPLFLFLSLLSKETGILFFPLLLLLLFSIKHDYKKFAVILLLPPLLLYSFIRIFIAGVFIGHVPHTVMGSLPLNERLVQIPAIIAFYFTTVFYPDRLAFGQTWVMQPSVSSLGLLSIVILIFQVVLSVLLWRMRKEPKYFFVGIFFVTWLIAGLLLHLQMLPLEMTVADRWFYFPFIGLLGMVGLFLTRVNKTMQMTLLFLFFISLPILGMRSWVRLGDWHDSFTLYRHDRNVTESYLLENSYGYELMERNEMESVYVPLAKSIKIFETTNNTNTLGVYYYKMNDIPQAIHWMTRSTKLGDNFLAYNNLARIQMAEKQFTKARIVLEQATRKFPQNDALWNLLALAYYKTGDTVGALIASENAYNLSPTQANSYIYKQLRAGEPIILNE